MLKRIPQKAQLDLFESAVLYISQADAARLFGVTCRMIQYWEAQGLLNPELPPEGRSRKYTSFDLVELKFIKTMLVDQGYTVPALKEKLESLKSPYYYDPENAFWDLRDKVWKSRTDFAIDELYAARDDLQLAIADVIERLLPGDLEQAARTLLDLVGQAIEGRVSVKRKRRARRPKP